MPKKREYRLIAKNGTEPLPARLMAIAEDYAMVRRKGCLPFVVSAKEWYNAPVAEGDFDG